VGASSREQAEILYRQAKGFVERSDRMDSIFRCFDGYRVIECKKNGSKIEIKAADPKTGDGVIPTFAIVEELHRHKDLSLYLLWRGKIEKRHGQIVAISTAVEPGSEFELARDSMRQSPSARVTREGAFVRAISPKFVLHDWAVPEDGDVEDLKVVKMANPLKAVTIQRLREIRNDPVQTLEHWRRFNCNLPTRGSLAAISEAEWQAASTDRRIPDHEPIWLGIDVSWKDDTTALVPFLARTRTDRLLGPATIVRAPRDGKLHPDAIKKAIFDIHTRTPIAVAVMDMFRAADIAAWIPGATGASVVARSQLDATAAIDYEKFMEALRNRWLLHAGDAGLTEHAMNAIAHMMPSGKHRFERPNRTQVRGRRIQPVDALIAAAMVNGEYAAPGDGGKPTTQRWGAA
jgi:phage terminase large subunit-like protein